MSFRQSEKKGEVVTKQVTILSKKCEVPVKARHLYHLTTSTSPTAAVKHVYENPQTIPANDGLSFAPKPPLC
jgi:hypothetical protein